MSVPTLTGFAAELREFALSLPETTEDFPWGERAFKVKTKAFVFLSMHDGELSFSVKLPKTGNQALALPFAEPTHYGLGKHGWVTIRPKKKSRRRSRRRSATGSSRAIALSPRRNSRNP